MLDRPTKVQSELLDFIASFIAEHGYGPSYREIMRSLNYKSVSTVAVHVDNLIRIGRLIKTDRSARSLVVVSDAQLEMPPATTSPTGAKWLIDQVGNKLADYQRRPNPKAKQDLELLAQALHLLGLEQEANRVESKLSGQTLA